MKKEYSAGGIVFRKNNSGWEVLLIRDMNNTWTFPKGKIETGETPIQAAIREIMEETRIGNLVVKKALPPIHYTFERNGKVYKTVRFYVFTTSDTQTNPQHDEGISTAEFFDSNAARGMLGYMDTQTELYRKALQLL